MPGLAKSTTPAKYPFGSRSRGTAFIPSITTSTRLRRGAQTRKCTPTPAGSAPIGSRRWSTIDIVNLPRMAVQNHGHRVLAGRLHEVTQNSTARIPARSVWMHALTLLRKDHSNVQSLFGEFEQTGRASFEKKDRLFTQIRRELQLHSRAEEEIFYPMVKALNG